MLTYYDCVGLTDLEEDEIEAIAQHEHVPEMIAAELGCFLVHDPTGIPRIQQILREDIENACLHGHPLQAAHWQQVLNNFSTNHPLYQQAA